MEVVGADSTPSTRPSSSTESNEDAREGDAGDAAARAYEPTTIRVETGKPMAIEEQDNKLRDDMDTELCSEDKGVCRPFFAGQLRPILESSTQADEAPDLSTDAVAPVMTNNPAVLQKNVDENNIMVRGHGPLRRSHTYRQGGLV